MKRCETPECDYYKKYGNCTEVCRRNEIKRDFTNGDAVRSMTDEELSKMIDQYHSGICGSVPVEDCKGNCYECKLEWLKKVRG